MLKYPKGAKLKEKGLQWRLTSNTDHICLKTLVILFKLEIHGQSLGQVRRPQFVKKSSSSVELWLTFLIVDKQRPKFKINFISFINWGRSFLFPAAWCCLCCTTAGVAIAWFSSTKSHCTIQICWIGRQKTKNCSTEGSKWFVSRGMNSYSISENRI